MSRMIRFHKFGAADVLRCEEQAEPSPAADEVQIRELLPQVGIDRCLRR